ncbi:hypothetical protein [Paenibacillus nasutitermitis]|uniref:Alkaline ceramidase n=1 Tax=Paenibacillus nasutitermitis TaxID=1652958 RepID=A0A917DQR9_9BACL|nr:hypothetical protein [Paenibacillus nasutitermitis]GGD60167.1 alkaline ceramidase [Paenibacillus nasutitermitis]
MRDDVSYEIGTYSVDITPPLTIPYLAGDPRHSFFTGIHDPLYACAAVISDGYRMVALVSIDGIGFSNGLLGKDRDFTDELKQRIEQATGIPKDCVMLMSGHIHSTPDTLDFRPLREIPAALSWLETLSSQICQAVSRAADHKFKARLKVGKGSAEGLIHNRRDGDELDSEVILLLFESCDQDRCIMLVNYACHPVIVQVQELVSADFIGSMRTALSSEIAGLEGCLFIQGACGEINPAVGCTKDFRDVEQFGRALANEVMSIYHQIADSGYEALPVQVAALSQTIQLASRPLPSVEEAYQISEDPAAREEAWWRIREGNSPYTAEIQFIRLGNCIIVGIPGEPMCMMGLALKEMFKPLTAVPSGYANGYLGYLASYEDWRQGGYEVELGPWSKVGPESYDDIMNKISQMKVTLITN